MRKEINIVWKIFLQYILWFGIFCVQFIEGATGRVRAFQLSDGRGNELLGRPIETFNETFNRNCNVLECEGIKYVNWFFPINALAGYQHFFDVYCRKRGFDLKSSAEELKGEGEDINKQRARLKNYIRNVQDYLGVMSKFYQTDSPWMTQQEVALGYLEEILDRIDKVTDADGLNIERSRLKEAGAVWPCMHTEPICVYDKWDRGNVIFSGDPVRDPVYMRSYLKPCSMTGNNWNCQEMLEAVARQIRRNINFGYYH